MSALERDAFESLSRASAAGLAVAVLAGGDSAEHEVSLESGRAVLAALRAAQATRAPRAVELIELPRQLAAGELWPVLERCRAEFDVVFVALHGGAGEDGRMQAALELLGIPHTGPDSGAAARAMDKQTARLLCAGAGCVVAPGMVLDAAAWASGREALLRRARRLQDGAGLVLKPRSDGSSVGLQVLGPDHLEDGPLTEAVEGLLRAADSVLIEARIEGVELTVPVDCRGGAGPVPWTPVEIRPAEGRTFDYEQKYSAAGARELCPPESLESAQLEALRAAACRAASALGIARGIVRADFIQPTAPGEPPVLLEVNGLPGLTERSLVRLSASHAGLEFSDLCLGLVAEAAER